MISMTEFTEPRAVNCPDCESARVVKIGTRNGYQRYLCRACSKKFHTNGKAKGRRFPADQMGAAIRMFYSGMSYQQIAENIGRTYDIPEPSKATIYQWVRDYTKDALKEMERRPAHTGGRWVVDQMQLDVGGQQYWIWNVMDGSTGYLLASHLTKERDARSALAILKKAAAAAAEPPRTVRTDRWAYYVLAVKQIFSRRQAPPVGGSGEPGGHQEPVQAGTGLVQAAHQDPAGGLVARKKANSTLTAGRWITTFSETTNLWTLSPPAKLPRSIRPSTNGWTW